MMNDTYPDNAYADDTQTDFEINLTDIFSFIRKGLLPALIVASLLGSITYFVSTRLAPTFRASSVIIISQPNNAEARYGVSLAVATPISVSGYSAAVKSTPVLGNALDFLQKVVTTETLENLRAKLSVRTNEDRISSLLTLSVVSDSADDAALSVNAISQALVLWDKQRATDDLEVIINTLNSQVYALDSEIQVIQSQANPSQQDLDSRILLRSQQAQQLLYAQTLKTSAVGLLKIIEPALPNLTPVAPRPLFNTIIALLLGTFLSYTFLLIRISVDNRLQSIDQIIKLSKLPSLGAIPKWAKGRRGMSLEASSYLRTRLLFALNNERNKSILVTSAIPAEGKSSVCIAIAESLSRNGLSTLLIDADLRKPVVAKEYNIDESSFTGTTLEDLLTQKTTKILPLRMTINGNSRLDIIPTFRPVNSPTELLNKSFQTIIKAASQHYDYVVVDCAPILPVADAHIVASMVSGTVLVTGMQVSNKNYLKNVTRSLQRSGFLMLGIVITQVKENRNDSEGYGYGYGYGFTEESSNAKNSKSETKKTLKQPVILEF